jgi:hypothetical protein
MSSEVKSSTELDFGSLVVKIGPKTKKVKKTPELAKKMSKMMVFSTVFQSFLVLGPILAHQTTKFELSG